MKKIKYPTRCRILDVTGQAIGHRDHQLPIRTPDQSKPHIGKEGLAEYMGTEGKLRLPIIRITLDDGTILWGYECWWEPIP